MREPRPTDDVAVRALTVVAGGLAGDNQHPPVLGDGSATAPQLHGYPSPRLDGQTLGELEPIRQDQNTALLSTTEAWDTQLDGVNLLQQNRSSWRGVGVGMWHFNSLPDHQPIRNFDKHCVSFTERGLRQIERISETGHSKANFRPGMAIILAAGHRSTWSWDNPADVMHLYVEPTFLLEVAAEAGLGSPVLIERFAFEDPFLRQAAYMLVNELRQPKVAGDLFADAAAQVIALHLLRTHCNINPREVPLQGGLSPAQVRRTRALIAEDLAAPLTLKDLAANAGVSRAHFVRGFRIATGISPHLYVINCRLDRAKQLLGSSRLSIAEIAAAVGFSSQSHFANTFRGRVGVTPSAYRRSL